ncbi:hypothetical protein BN1050_01760 [Metalysinibacillus saudimassiliensis]|uniref:Uncharacterized protein n=1 Tax=Metalysinibacillus saudimassiliensis TaxID=1461583 RepID=A0A078MH16_9BACL|nr:hypothetical protein BN1050_01760 [Metalysinibacillus saudimassiliensis]
MLWYKISKKIVVHQDYIDWALYEIMNGRQDVNLYALASYTADTYTYMIEDAFYNYQKRMGIPTPYEQLASYINGQIAYIQQGEQWEEAIIQLMHVWLAYGQPEPLEVWFELSEMLDDIRYSDNPKNLTKQYVCERAQREAAKHITMRCFTKEGLWT